MKQAELELFTQNEHLALLCEVPDPSAEDDASDPLQKEIKRVSHVCNQLSGVTVIRKGLLDIVSDGERTIIVANSGSMKRCGGQGDVLCGTIGTFANYSFRMGDQSLIDDQMFQASGKLLSCAIGSITVREAARQSF